METMETKARRSWWVWSVQYEPELSNVIMVWAPSFLDERVYRTRIMVPRSVTMTDALWQQVRRLLTGNQTGSPLHEHNPHTLTWDDIISLCLVARL
jgi:hypothetical protein